MNDVQKLKELSETRQMVAQTISFVERVPVTVHEAKNVFNTHSWLSKLHENVSAEIDAIVKKEMTPDVPLAQ